MAGEFTSSAETKSGYMAYVSEKTGKVKHKEIEYAIVNGRAVFEGDIVIGTEEMIAAAEEEGAQKRSQRIPEGENCQSDNDPASTPGQSFGPGFAVHQGKVGACHAGQGAAYQHTEVAYPADADALQRKVVPGVLDDASQFCAYVEGLWNGEDCWPIHACLSRHGR